MWLLTLAVSIFFFMLMPGIGKVLNQYDANSFEYKAVVYIGMAVGVIGFFFLFASMMGVIKVLLA